MNTKTVAVLAVLAAGLAVGAYVSTRPAPAPADPQHAGAKLFPELAGKLNAVASVEIKDANRSLQLRRASEGTPPTWVVPEKADYPAEFTRVRDALIGLADATIVEPKTSKPDFYARIGVDGPDKPASTSTLVTLKDSAGAVLASVIVGNASDPGRSSGGETETRFVRRADEPRSYLVAGRTRFETDVFSWMERVVLQLERNRVKSVRISHATPEGYAPELPPGLELSRASETTPDFTIVNLPPGRQPKDTFAPNQAGGALSYVSFDDVKPVGEVDFSTLVPSASVAATQPATPSSEPSFLPANARFATFDGLVITAKVTRKDSLWWLSLTAEFDEKEVVPVPTPPPPKEGEPAPPPPPARKSADEVKKEAEALRAKLAPWAFQISEWNGKQLATRLTDLLKEPEPAKGPEAAGPSPEPPPPAPAPADFGPDDLLKPDPPK